ncbi:hypothetical protein CERSUDRAFT_76188 [Gelatoporia subvermispora B]|uniref:C2H2-type domain-containing protein n=1 Tax=Ceriporiopsis subvermispora (strain B) TaxID=914234 RepID=M2PDX8_CERS8|nr:hypothetical protein CERSUDRAFT_76188 [Gelatoporia subvermispora B]
MSSCTCEKAVVCEMICKENIVQVLNFPNGHSPECGVHQDIAQRLRDSAPPLVLIPQLAIDHHKSDSTSTQLRPVTDFQRGYLSTVSAEDYDDDVSMEEDEQEDTKSPIVSTVSIQTGGQAELSGKVTRVTPRGASPESSNIAKDTATQSSIADYPPSSKVSIADEPTSDEEDMLIKEEEDEKPVLGHVPPKRFKQKRRMPVPVAGRGYQCLIDDCGFEFNGPRERLRHMDTHFGHLSLFQCPGCKDFMARADSLKRHCNTPAKRTCLEAAMAEGGELGGIHWQSFCIVESGHWFWEREHIFRVRVPPPGDPLINVRADVRRSFGLDPFA